MPVPAVESQEDVVVSYTHHGIMLLGDALSVAAFANVNSWTTMIAVIVADVVDRVNVKFASLVEYDEHDETANIYHLKKSDRCIWTAVEI